MSAKETEEAAQNRGKCETDGRNEEVARKEENQELWR